MNDLCLIATLLWGSWGGQSWATSMEVCTEVAEIADARGEDVIEVARQAWVESRFRDGLAHGALQANPRWWPGECRIHAAMDARQAYRRLAGRLWPEVEKQSDFR